MWQSRKRPDLGWGRPIAAVLAGVFLPAIPAGLLLWVLDADIGAIYGGVLRLCWYVAACLMATPLVAWIAVPVATPLARLAARIGWAGPVSLIALAVLIGLPLAHIVLNGDLTSEAPEMIPVLALTFSIQALTGWIILRGGTERAAMAKTPAH